MSVAAKQSVITSPEGEMLMKKKEMSGKEKGEFGVKWFKKAT